MLSRSIIWMSHAKPNIHIEDRRDKALIDNRFSTQDFELYSEHAMSDLNGVLLDSRFSKV